VSAGLLALGRLAVNVVVAKQSLHRRLHVAAAKSYHDDVDVRHAARVAAPRKGAMSEADFEPWRSKRRGPELRDLLALRDGVRGDESDARTDSYR